MIRVASYVEIIADALVSLYTFLVLFLLTWLAAVSAGFILGGGGFSALGFPAIVAVVIGPFPGYGWIISCPLVGLLLIIGLYTERLALRCSVLGALLLLAVATGFRLAHWY